MEPESQHFTIEAKSKSLAIDLGSRVRFVSLGY